MPLDATDKKLFAQLDDPAPGQRANALELLRDRLAKKSPPETFVDLLTVFGEAVPRAQYDAAIQANDTLSGRYKTALAKHKATLAQLAILKGALALKVYWQHALGCLALPAIGLTAYLYTTAEPASGRAAADRNFQRIAAATAWADTAKDSVPAVQWVAGAPYWVIVRRDQDTTHVTDNSEPVTVQCVRVFADKAEAEAGAYLRPHPYSLSGWGWLTWPERGVDCRTEAARVAANAKPQFQSMFTQPNGAKK